MSAKIMKSICVTLMMIVGILYGVKPINDTVCFDGKMKVPFIQLQLFTNPLLCLNRMECIDYFTKCM